MYAQSKWPHPAMLAFAIDDRSTHDARWDSQLSNAQEIFAFRANGEDLRPHHDIRRKQNLLNMEYSLLDEYAGFGRARK